MGNMLELFVEMWNGEKWVAWDDRADADNESLSMSGADVPAGAICLSSHSKYAHFLVYELLCSTKHGDYGMPRDVSPDIHFYIYDDSSWDVIPFSNLLMIYGGIDAADSHVASRITEAVSVFKETEFGRTANREYLFTYLRLLWVYS